MGIKRSSGILLPIAALPSEGGIGTLGRAAYEFVDFLAAAGQSWWQILPAGPTSYGDSPYQSFSTFAGNPYFVDLEELCRQGLLSPEEWNTLEWGGNPRYVDYGTVYRQRFGVLAKAAERAWQRQPEAIQEFVQANAGWLPDYALYMAVKKHFGMRAWTEWEDEAIRLHRPEAVAAYTEKLQEDVRLFEYIQYEFFAQWQKLRAYAREKGIGIIGDLPIYVAMDSADVWAGPENFQLDEENLPLEVAGVPPDYFSKDGQLWGNPLYNWERMKQDGYGWWIRRIDGAARLYDVVRIDHFRGFESYWAVPFGAKTAREGRWVKGPGMDLVGVLTSWFPQLQLIAEDLGILTPEVHQLLQQSGLPGMKVLEFAFNPTEPSSYLPHNYTENCVCYAGTHDNAPIMAWKAEAKPEELRMATEYLGLSEAEGLNWGLIRGGMTSVAALFVAQLQDYLGLGAEARTNTPGVLGGNWQWRVRPEDLTAELEKKIRHLTWISGRTENQA